MALIIPFVFIAVFGFAIFKKVKIYDEFKGRRRSGKIHVISYTMSCRNIYDVRGF